MTGLILARPDATHRISPALSQSRAPSPGPCIVGSLQDGSALANSRLPKWAPTGSSCGPAAQPRYCGDPRRGPEPGAISRRRARRSGIGRSRNGWDYPADERGHRKNRQKGLPRRSRGRSGSPIAGAGDRGACDSAVRAARHRRRRSSRPALHRHRPSACPTACTGRTARPSANRIRP